MVGAQYELLHTSYSVDDYECFLAGEDLEPFWMKISEPAFYVVWVNSYLLIPFNVKNQASEVVAR